MSETVKWRKLHLHEPVDKDLGFRLCDQGGGIVCVATSRIAIGEPEWGNGYYEYPPKLRLVAERLRDCWNACDGIDEPAKLRSQRDRLLAMLEEVMSSDPDMIGHKRTMEDAEELIAECRS